MAQREVSHLLDASSLLLLTRSTDEESKLKVIETASTLDLAFCEIGNAIWKESELLKKLSEEEADRLARAVQVVLANIVRIQTSQEDLLRILAIARKEKKTFYDSAYIYVANKEKMTLVTDDERLSRTASKYIRTISVSDLSSRL